MTEYGRCKCGSVRFQHSFELSDGYIVCAQCNMVWGIEYGKLKRFKNEFTPEKMNAIIAGKYSLQFACKPEEFQKSLLDYILDEIEY